LFIPGPEIPLDNGPVSIAIADFNGDGIVDAAVSGALPPQVDVLLACKPSRNLPCDPGAFNPPISLRADRALRKIITVDYNGDGTPDIVGVDSFGGLSVVGKDCPARRAVSLGVADPGPVALAAGNFDDANGADVVTVNGGAAAITIY